MVGYVAVGAVGVFDAEHADATGGTRRVGPPRLRVRVVTGAEPTTVAHDVDAVVMVPSGAEQAVGRRGRIGRAVVRDPGRADGSGNTLHARLDHQGTAGRTATTIEVEPAFEHAHRFVAMVGAPLHHRTVAEFGHHEPQRVVVGADPLAPRDTGNISSDRVGRRGRNLVETDGRK